MNAPTRLLAAFALAALLAACGGGGGGGGGTTPPADGPTARKTIGSAGGSLESDDGALTLSIPAGALGNDVEITITELNAANVPQALKDLGADRAWRLGPDGQTFAQPVAVQLPLPAGNAVVALLHASGGEVKLADGARLEYGATARTLSAQLGHFSHLATARLRGFDFLPLSVAPRALVVGDRTVSRFTLRKTAADAETEATCDWSPDASSTGVLKQIDTSTDCFFGVSLQRGTVRDVVGRATYECVKEGSQIVSASYLLEAVELNIVFGSRTLLEGSLRLSQSLDVVCREDDNPVAGLKVGLFPMPFGMSLPDGATIVNVPFANLSGDGPYVLIAGSNGAVAMDLVTGLSALNQTPSGPDSALGGNLLGVTAISRPNPGPGTPAALFGTTQSGSGSYLRNWDSTAGLWGLTQVSPLTSYIDASNAGGGLVADEMVTVTAGGLGFVRYDTSLGFYTGLGGGGISALQLGGAPRSAAMPDSAVGSPVLVGIPGAAGGANAKVVVHQRMAGANAVPLFSLDGPDLAQLRCAGNAGGDVVYCGVTGGASVYLFRYDKRNPTATPAFQKVATGAGALGVEFGVLADGRTGLAVSNFDADTVSIVALGANGVVDDTTSVSLPPGCGVSAHAALVSRDDKDYVFGTCYDSARYFGINIRF